MAAVYEAKLTQDNGTCYSRKFEDYDAMCRWIAAEPDAGIVAWADSEPIDQAELQADVQMYQ